MKKLLLLLSLCVVNFSTFGQIGSSCQTYFTDTVKYIEEAKTSVLLGISVNTNNDATATGYGYAGFAQIFAAPDSIRVLGFSFGGWISSGFTDTVVCRLYQANGSGMPGVQIDSVLHAVSLENGFTAPLTSNQINNEVLFGAGHVLEGDYIITVENFSTSDLFLVRSSAGDGSAEGLCLLYYRGLSDPSFDGWYSAVTFGSQWDFDMNFKPIIEYSVTSELIFSDDTLCQNDLLMVTGAIVSFDDSLLYNRMYNPNYASYTGYTVNNSLIYHYGNGNSDAVGAESYMVSGDYTITGMDTLFTDLWTANSVEVICSGMVNVNGADLGMDTIVCMQNVMVISPGVFDTYSWNTGVVTDSITIGPILNPGVITYTVDVTSGLCNSTASITITFENCTGIEEAKNHSLNAFPNPASDNFTIKTDFTENFELKIYDNQGKVVMVQRLTGIAENIDVSRLSEGMYVVVISDKNRVVRKKVQILR